MFDIAWSELFVIVIVALVVVGPKDLPKLMRTAGQWAGRARAMADQFRRSFDDMARQAELDELRSEVSKLRQDTVAPMSDLDYKSFGIPENPVPGLNTLGNPIEDVGAEPPRTFAPRTGNAAEEEAMAVFSGAAPAAPPQPPPASDGTPPEASPAKS